MVKLVKFAEAAVAAPPERASPASVELDYCTCLRTNRGMKTSSYSDLRKNLASMLDSVVADHEPMIITRDRGKPAAVLMSLEDYASFEETRYLLRSPANAERLMDAVTALDAGKGKARKLAASKPEK